ncbi:MAG: asparagine synthase (glutamine-hydrolyzing) [Ignavibacteria bacterium]|nr:asparagine synthase (glutamine-hydrolyzing) [Ignavibacteria bacterium]
MCGIAGIVEHSSAESKISEQILKSMSDVMIHRGPDAEGSFISNSRMCGLSFRRLSIIDLSTAGNQPMTTPDGRYSIVFNGEIYNHAVLRRDLIEKGYKYHSGTDTETILNGFAEYGKDILSKIEGMWAFAIWDEEKKELFCSRDRIGKKPFYFTNQNGRFIFASEIKSILRHPDISAELNTSELPVFINLGMSSNRNTLFSNIHKIPAGHSLTLKKNGEFTLERYWSPLSKDMSYTELRGKNLSEELLRLLRQSISDRMMSDVPFGVFLSGGIDSSLNVALMAELMDRPVDTFTIGFKELEKYNELEYARKISKQFSTNHHEILIDDKDALPVLSDLVWHEDEPNGDPVCIPLYFLSKLTHDAGTTVVQVGEGSDEEFAGYTWQLRDYNFYRRYWKHFNKLPDILKKSAYHISKQFFNSTSQLLPLEFIRRAAFNEQFYWTVPVFTACHHEYMYNLKEYKDNTLTSQYINSLSNEAKSFKKDADFLQQVFFIELNQRLAELLLMRVDKIGMAHSIEARVPFLDYRIVELAMSLPQDVKVPNSSITKFVLKNAIGNILPDDIINRRKQGFWAPVNEWIRNQWFDYVKSEILNSKLLNSGIFNIEFFKDLLNKHREGKGNFGFQLFDILSLSLWHKRFFE